MDRKRYGEKDIIRLLREFEVHCNSSINVVSARCAAIAALGEDTIQNSAFMTNGTPKIKPIAIALGKNLIKTPSPI